MSSSIVAVVAAVAVAAVVAEDEGRLHDDDDAGEGDADVGHLERAQRLLEEYPGQYRHEDRGHRAQHAAVAFGEMEKPFNLALDSSRAISLSFGTVLQ